MKTTLITGANRGLGLGFTRHYLSAGDRVFATSRNPADCAEFDELLQAFGDRFTSLQLDVSDEESIAGIASELDGTKFDLVLNNAGACPDEVFGQWTTATFELAFGANVIGPALVAQALTPLMNEGALLINISSGLASCGLNINPETGLDAYSASKTALNMVTRRLAAKLASKNITVAAFDPGWVKTRMGGDEAELTIDESISALTASIERLTPDDSGLFFSRDGEVLPW